MVERKNINREITSQSGATPLERIRNLPIVIKSLVAGVAASAAFTLSEGTANAAMSAADQVTEYSDLTKVDTKATNPYPNTSLDLGALGVISRVSGDFQLSGVPLSRVGVDSTYPATEVIDSTSYVIVKYQAQIGDDSDVAIYDKSNLMGNPVVLKHDDAIVLKATLGEVKINNRTFIVVKADSVGTSHLVFTPAASQAPAMIQLVGSSNPIVSPVINGLSANGINENDIVAAKNDVSGKQTLVVKNQQGTFDIFEQTYDQGANTNVDHPNPEFQGLDTTFKIDPTDRILSIPETQILNEMNVKISFFDPSENRNVEKVGTLVDGKWQFDVSELDDSELSNPVSVDVIASDEDGDEQMATTSIELDRENMVMPDAPTVNEDVFPRAFGISPNNHVVNIAGIENAHTIEVVFADLEEGHDQYFLVQNIDSGSAELNFGVEYISHGVQTVQIVITGEGGEVVLERQLVVDKVEPTVNVLDSVEGILEVQDDNLMGEVDLKVMINENEAQYTVMNDNKYDILGGEPGDQVTYEAKDGLGNVFVDTYTIPNVEEPKDPKDPDKEPKDPVVDPDGPGVTPPIDGGNDDDPSCAVVGGVDAGKKAPTKEGLTFASLLALAAFWRRKKK